MDKTYSKLTKSPSVLSLIYNPDGNQTSNNKLTKHAFKNAFLYIIHKKKILKQENEWCTKIYDKNTVETFCSEFGIFETYEDDCLLVLTSIIKKYDKKFVVVVGNTEYEPFKKNKYAFIIIDDDNLIVYSLNKKYLYFKTNLFSSFCISDLDEYASREHLSKLMYVDTKAEITYDLIFLFMSKLIKKISKSVF